MIPMPVEINFYARRTYLATEEILVFIELFNNTGDEFTYLSRNTPFDKAASEHLHLSLNGHSIPYDGYFYKRQPPSPDEYLRLAPSQRISTSVVLNKLFKIEASGIYHLTLRQAIMASPIPETHGISFHVQGAIRDRIRTIGELSRNIPAGTARRFTPDAATLPPPIVINAPSPDQQNTILAAHQNAYNMLLQSIADLPNDNTQNYLTWFGVPDDVRFAQVTGTYNKIEAYMEDAGNPLTYDLSGTGCPDGVFAYTTLGGYTIWPCSLFWTAPALGDDSQAGTLIHELSHAATSTVDDGIYGEQNSQNLAITDPDTAVNHADNYEYFSENC